MTGMYTLEALKELGGEGSEDSGEDPHNGELTKKVIIEGLKVSASAIKA